MRRGEYARSALGGNKIYTNMYDQPTYEEQIEDLYKEFNRRKENGENPDRNIYRIRKRMLQNAIEERDKHETKTL